MFQRLVSCIVKRCQVTPISNVLSLRITIGWNGRDCVSGQKTTSRIGRWSDHAGSQKSTPWSRHLTSENGAQQRCRGLFSVFQHVLEEDEIETDSCKSSSPSISYPLPKHTGSSIVGAVQEYPKFTNNRATNASRKVHVQFLASLPDHSQILSCSRGEKKLRVKIWALPGNVATKFLASVRNDLTQNLCKISQSGYQSSCKLSDLLQCWLSCFCSAGHLSASV